MNRGEIWWVDRPGIGRRPHLVLTRQTAVHLLHSVIGVPATRTLRGIRTEVALSQAEGMPEDCVLNLDSVTLLPKLLFVERICRLSSAKMREVCAALAFATGCDSG